MRTSPHELLTVGEGHGVVSLPPTVPNGAQLITTNIASHGTRSCNSVANAKEVV